MLLHDANPTVVGAVRCCQREEVDDEVRCSARDRPGQRAVTMQVDHSTDIAALSWLHSVFIVCGDGLMAIDISKLEA